MAKNGSVCTHSDPATSYGPGTEFEYDCLVNCSSPFLKLKVGDDGNAIN